MNTSGFDAAIYSLYPGSHGKYYDSMWDTFCYQTLQKSCGLHLPVRKLCRKVVGGIFKPRIGTEHAVKIIGTIRVKGQLQEYNPVPVVVYLDWYTNNFNCLYVTYVKIISIQ